MAHNFSKQQAGVWGSMLLSLHILAYDSWLTVTESLQTGGRGVVDDNFFAVKPIINLIFDTWRCLAQKIVRFF